MNAKREHWSDCTTLREAVLAYVRQMDHTSFAELDRRFHETFGTRGNVALHLPGYENIVLWSDMSQEFADVILDLIQSEDVVPHPSSFLVYLCDGMVPQMPLAKRKCHYKKPHWFPVMLRPGVHANAS